MKFYLSLPSPPSTCAQTYVACVICVGVCSFLGYTDPHAGGWGGIAESGAPVPSDGAYANETWPDVEKDHASVISTFQGTFGRGGQSRVGMCVLCVHTRFTTATPHFTPRP